MAYYMGKEVKLWPCHYHSRIALGINWTNLTSMAKSITFCWANPWFFNLQGWLQSLQSSFTTIQSQYLNRVSLDFRIFISLQLISPENFWEWIFGRDFLKGIVNYNLIWLHHSKILQSFYLLCVLCVVSHFMCEASFGRHPNHCDPSQNMQITCFFGKFGDVSQIRAPKIYWKLSNSHVLFPSRCFAAKMLWHQGETASCSQERMVIPGH